MIFTKQFSKKLDSPEKPKSEIKLIPILRANQLLANLRSQSWLNKIKGYLRLPDEHFEVLYVNLIEKFAEFVQILPLSTEGKLGSLLSESLARSILALKALYESEPEKINNDPRYCYAVFTAALLVNIGAITNSKVVISDAEGRFIADWLPYQGSLVGKGEYYKLHRYSQVPVHLHRHTVTILAKQLMPHSGFLWLAEDMKLFHMWLSLLNDDRANAGGMELLLAVSPEELEQAFEQDKVFLFDEIEQIPTPETQEAENFLLWLKNEIEKGNITVNTTDANVVVLQEGVFISMNVFKDFCSAFSAQHYTVLVKAFNHLGLTELSGGDLKFLQYFEKGIPEKQKVDFKNEPKNAMLGFIQKNTHTAALEKNKLAEKEGVLVKEAELLFKESVEVSKTAQLSPSSSVSPQLPRLETTLGMEFLARLT